MSTGNSHEPDNVESILERLGRVVDAEEFEMVWAEGLRRFRAPDDRERILVAAGTRLRVFDAVTDDGLRRSWLRHVVEETRLRGVSPLGETLAPIASAELREAFAHAAADLAELRAAADAGEGMREFAARSPSAAARVRDLGRIADRLRGSGLMALVGSEDAELARVLAVALTSRRHLLATVPEPLRVTREQLLQWAASAGADRELPRLIRSLIAETEPSAEWIDMPAGTGVAASGWDGVIRCSDGNRFVPAGLSKWELSTEQRTAYRKACEDYDRRVQTTLSTERAGTAYVAVVCARWTKARDFAHEMSQRRDFRSVQALNADSIEAWLECAPGHNHVAAREDGRV